MNMLTSMSSVYTLRPQKSRDDLAPTVQPLVQQQQQQQQPEQPEQPQLLFQAEEISRIAREAIEEVLGESEYLEGSVTTWNNTIIDHVLSELVKLKKPYKYVVKCSLRQRTGTGLHLASAAFWEVPCDGTCTVRWDNQYIHCSLHVFGVAI